MQVSVPGALVSANKNATGGKGFAWPVDAALHYGLITTRSSVFFWALISGQRWRESFIYGRRADADAGSDATGLNSPVLFLTHTSRLTFAFAYWRISLLQSCP